MMMVAFYNSHQIGGLILLSVIYIVVSLIILLLCALCGFFGGRRKGALRSLVKLAALILSVVITVVILLCLRGVVADIIAGFIPDELSRFQWVIDLLVQVPASIVLLIVFWMLFSIVRLLMLIPQSIISKRLPRTFDELKFKAQTPAPAALSPEHTVEETSWDSLGESSDAMVETVDEANEESASASEEAPLSPSEPAAPFVQEEPMPDRRRLKLIWSIGGALCGILSSLLLLGAFLMPISGTVTRAGDALFRVTDAVNQENPNAVIGEISNHAKMLSDAPLFTVTDFFYGKTVYEPLTTFKSKFGKINLSAELENATDIACDLIPVAVHLDENGTVSEDDVDHLAACVGHISESELILALGTYYLNEAGSKLDDSTGSEAKKALMAQVRDILADMEPDSLSADMNTLVELIGALSESPLLKVLTSDEKKLEPADLTDRETLRELFGILYDNDHTKHLLVPLINLGTESVFKAAGAKPIYSDTDIDKVGRDELTAEADRLCDAIEGITEFADSLSSENASVATYRLSAAGKALDSLRDSVFFGKQYDAMVSSLTEASGADSQSSSLMNALGDALLECESAEQFLNSAQSVAVMNDALEKGETKGRENKDLVASLDTLLNHTSPEDADLLADISGDSFLSENQSVSDSVKKEIAEDCVKTVQALSAEENENIEAEADAVQVIYDLSRGSAQDIFANVSEADAIKALAESKVAYEMFSNLNAEGRDYGIRAKLSAENRQKLAQALEQSSASEAQKQVIAEFFGLN